jgi:hypothetical protein
MINDERQMTQDKRLVPYSTHHTSQFTFYTLRLHPWLIACLILPGQLLVLAGCGTSVVTQTARTEHYTVQMSLDGVGFGAHEMTIELRDGANNPATVDQVVIAPIMPQMGMADPEMIAQSIGPGRYRASGDFFSMIGEWEINVRISAGGAEELTTFKVQTTQ